jgi:predicted DNA-binding transcriptional regulator YafY
MRKKYEPGLNAAGPEQEKRTIPPALAAHSWRPGQSGNPGGRTIEFADCQRLCREASPDAARRLIELMNSEDERVALMAADKVLERAWGRPKEPDQATSLEHRLAAMTPDERRIVWALLVKGGIYRAPVAAA